MQGVESKVELEEGGKKDTGQILRQLLIADMVKLLGHWCTGFNRTRPIRYWVMVNIQKKDPETKKGRKEAMDMDLLSIEWNTLTDEQLVEVYHLVIRRAYTCM